MHVKTKVAPTSVPCYSTHMTTLTAEQSSGIEAIKKWYEDAIDGLAGPYRLFGPAGTGKTTMAKHIPAALGVSAKFMAYTGKAAHVLTRKGVEARTIHSSIYYPTADENARAELRKAERSLGILRNAPRDEPESDPEISAILTQGGGSIEETIADLSREITELTARTKRMSWEWNPEAMMEDMPGILILDEVSMVNEKLATDIERYEIPVLVLGDPSQLPPVEGGGHYINAQPDFMLEEIHRQALESPVLELATRIRLSQGGRLGMTGDDLEPASLAAAMQADQVIVWSNKRRWAMIDAMRRNWGRPNGVPVKDDRIMCLTNNRDLAVFNGQQFTVLHSTQTAMGPTVTVQDDDGRTRTIPTFADGFAGMDLEKQAKGSGAGIRGGRMLATFAQAITCHKSQGSEWNHVYVVNELPAMMGMTARREGQAAAEGHARRWIYTAVTRASERVTVTRPPTGR